MRNQKSDDIAKGNLIVPSHRPMSGVDDDPIDVGAPDKTRSPNGKSQPASQKQNNTEPGISPSTHRDHLF